jgi:hypothetical protein
MTQGRRSEPLPQIKCESGYGNPDCSKGPKEIRCEIIEKFGNSDAIWKCTGIVGSAYKISKYTVSCEGYEYPDDPFILDGSCGVEYVLELTEEGERLRKQEAARQEEYQRRLSQHNERQSYEELQGQTKHQQIIIEETIKREPVYNMHQTTYEDFLIGTIILIILPFMGLYIAGAYLYGAFTQNNSYMVYTTDGGGTNVIHGDIIDNNNLSGLRHRQTSHATIVNPPVSNQVYVQPTPVYTQHIPVYAQPVHRTIVVNTPAVAETKTVRTTIINSEPHTQPPMYSSRPVPSEPINTDGTPRVVSGFASTKKR